MKVKRTFSHLSIITREVPKWSQNAVKYALKNTSGVPAQTGLN